MTKWLLADIGGTNARFALASDGALIDDSITHYRNDDFDSFASVLHRYLESQPHEVSACCVAVAGQVNGPVAQMTNRDWAVTKDEISTQTGCRDIELINDLYALGRSLTQLGPDGLSPIQPKHPDHQGNGQSLVVNIGTGFNIAFVMATAQGANSARAEAGHSSLPLSVFRQLEDLLGERADAFLTTEHCFSGRGLANVNAAAFGTEPRQGADIVADGEKADDGSDAAEFMTAYARMLGTLLREMALSLLPTSGIYFVGSVARGVLQSRFASDVTRAFGVPTSPAMTLPPIPMSLIKSDNAGVLGCLAVLSERDRG